MRRGGSSGQARRSARMDGSDPARIEQGDWPSKVVVADKCMLGFPTSKAHYQVDVYARLGRRARRKCLHVLARHSLFILRLHSTCPRTAGDVRAGWKRCSLRGSDLFVIPGCAAAEEVDQRAVRRCRHWTAGRSPEGDEWADAVHSFWCRWVGRTSWPGVAAIADNFDLFVVTRRSSRQGRPGDRRRNF